jgi:hypothetical protein
MWEAGQPARRGNEAGAFLYLPAQTLDHQGSSCHHQRTHPSINRSLQYTRTIKTSLCNTFLLPKKPRIFSLVNSPPTITTIEPSHPLSTTGQQPTTNHGSIILPDLPRGIQQQVVLLRPSQRRCRPQGLCHMPDDDDDSRYQQR